MKKQKNDSVQALTLAEGGCSKIVAFFALIARAWCIATNAVVRTRWAQRQHKRKFIYSLDKQKAFYGHWLPITDKIVYTSSL